MNHFFISYKHTDSAFVAELQKHLDEAAIDYWTDHRLLPGDVWDERIDRHIEQAAGVLVVVTPESLMSPYVIYEWSFAKGWGGGAKPVIPLILRRPNAESKVTFRCGASDELDIEVKIHPKLERLQQMDFTDPGDQPWGKLIDSLKTILSKSNLSEIMKEKDNELNTSDPNERARTIQWLRDSDDPQASIVLGKNASEHTQRVVRVECAVALCQRTNNSDPLAIRGLRDIVDIGEYKHCEIATQALADLASNGNEDAIDILISAFSTPGKHLTLRELAVNKLAVLRNACIVPALLEGLPKADAHVQQAIISALGLQHATEAIDSLHAMLSYTDLRWPHPRRLALLTALSNIGDRGIGIVAEFISVTFEQEAILDDITKALAQKDAIEQSIPILQQAIDKQGENARKQALARVLRHVLATKQS